MQKNPGDASWFVNNWSAKYVSAERGGDIAALLEGQKHNEVSRTRLILTVVRLLSVVATGVNNSELSLELLWPAVFTQQVNIRGVNDSAESRGHVSTTFESKDFERVTCFHFTHQVGATWAEAMATAPAAMTFPNIFENLK